MESGMMNAMGMGDMDPFVIYLILFLFIIVLAVLFIVQLKKYSTLERRMHAFMTGADGASLEEKMSILFSDVRKLKEHDLVHKGDISQIKRNLLICYQKVGLVKYDAFREMGGQLSFSIALLDKEDSGFIINSVHSANGCYVYTKEIENGRSALDLSEEEQTALRIAIDSAESATVRPSGRE